MSTGKSPALAKESKGNIWPRINCHLKFLTGDPIAFNREKLSNRENAKQKSILENTRSKKESEEGCAPKYDAPSLLGHFCPPLWQNWWEQQAGRQSQPQDKLCLQSQEIYFAESRDGWIHQHSLKATPPVIICLRNSCFPAISTRTGWRTLVEKRWDHLSEAF